jgi:hypothetical protein
MKILPVVFALASVCANANTEDAVYHGSTPANAIVRDFLHIPLEDSIDFIRWNLVLINNQYNLKCEFGISRGGTNGFIDRNEVVLSGRIEKDGNLYMLLNGDKTLYMLKINSNLFHLLDKKKTFLVGNGGYSYALNINKPVKSDELNVQFTQFPAENPMAFQGRTPCQELSRMMGLNKSEACDKMKWYIILYLDPVTKEPAYYLSGGRGYKKETMAKGNWEITQGKNGRVIYKLDPEKKASSIHLIKADDNILFFTDPEGNLLVGNENFSYTLNRTKDLEGK